MAHNPELFIRQLLMTHKSKCLNDTQKTLEVVKRQQQDKWHRKLGVLWYIHPMMYKKLLEVWMILPQKDTGDSRDVNEMIQRII